MPTVGSVAAGQTAGMTPSRRQFVVMTLLFVTMAINYLDRSRFPSAAPALVGAFHLDPDALRDAAQHPLSLEATDPKRQGGKRTPARRCRMPGRHSR